MSSINVTLKLNPGLYKAYRSYCKKKGLKVSQQVEIMMEEAVGKNYQRYTSNNVETYSASLTGEPFMVHETKIIADMILQETPSEIIKKTAVRENIFGYKTIKSIPKRVNAILKRIQHLDPLLLEKIVNDLSGDGKVVILYSIYARDKLFREFLNDMLADRFSIRDFVFNKKEISKFIHDKSDISRKVQEYTPETKAKLANVFFNIIQEAGLITSTENNILLNNLLISSDLRNYLENTNQTTFLKSIGALQ